jgi:hypothetical protein
LGTPCKFLLKNLPLFLRSNVERRLLLPYLAFKRAFLKVDRSGLQEKDDSNIKIMLGV